MCGHRWPGHGLGLPVRGRHAFEPNPWRVGRGSPRAKGGDEVAPLPAAALDIFEAVLTKEEVERALLAIGELEADQGSFADGDLDSVDKHASFCLGIIEKGAWKPNVKPLQEVLEEPLERLAQRVRSWDAGESGELGPSYALVRHYAVGERREHPVHFDHHAMITAVCSLSPPQAGSGLFVQQGPHVSSREYVPFGAAGDFAVHKWDLAHGVDISGDEERFSLIVWFTPRADSVTGGTGWYEALAESGHAEAQYRVGMVRVSEGDTAAAEQWLRRAAEQQHWFAKHSLGQLFLQRGEVSSAEAWFRDAAEQGYAAAQVDLGDILRERSPEEAEELYEAAAAQGYRLGQSRAGHAKLMRGDFEGGRQLLEPAAEKGWATAQLDMAALCRRSGEGAKAKMWLQRAAAQGHPAGAEQLAVAASMVGDMAEARRWWGEGAKLGSASAMRNFANCLEHGTGGDVDREAAADWLERAAREEGR